MADGKHRGAVFTHPAFRSLVANTDAYRWFFPAATLYGMVVLPISVYSLTTGVTILAGIATPLGHAHELLFGYALGVATGFLLNRVPRWWIFSLFFIWCGARIGYLLAPGSLFADLANLLFALGFAVSGSSRFLPRAKKWRNKAFGLNLIILGVAAASAHGVIERAPVYVIYLATYEAVLMIALLMLLMGGRLLAPAIAGHIESEGGSLEARVQPRLEGAIIILMLLGGGAYLLPVPSMVPGVLIAMAGLTAILRLARWRLWACLDRLDLLGLAVGYAWVSGGLLYTGARLMLGLGLTAALHAITVGAIGTLTLCVMSRTWMQRSGVHPNEFVGLKHVVGLVSLSAVLRLVSGTLLDDWAGLAQLLAAIAWSTAFAMVLVLVMIKYPGRKFSGR
ncbi:MAG: NnrS family protein [Pseudomonadales bacterium]